jgi:adenylyltransferase/sulfurtransferase
MPALVASGRRRDREAAWTEVELSAAEIERYGRHLILAEVGLDGQRTLKAARVLVVGVGGLGSPVSLYLAAAGVGTLGLVDFDVVDRTNLQRQILHGTADVGRNKLDSAIDRIGDVNPHVRIERFDTRLTSANALEIIRQFDLVVDGTDNFATRYLVNDACVLTGRPNVYGSILRFEGQSSVFARSDGPCYRCLFPQPPSPGLVPNCAEAGVMGMLPGLVGTIQAAEAAKLILGVGEPLVGRLLVVDALAMRFRTLPVRRDPACPACGTRELRRLVDYEQLCGLKPVAGCAGDGVLVDELTPQELAGKMARGDAFELIDVREPHEYAIARIPGSRLIPLASLTEAIPTLARDRDLVVHCKAGGRSAKAVRTLSDAGFVRVWNLSGGIARWSDEVDPGVPKY